MIRANLIGQLGNQMWIYCAAKVLADRTGLAYTPPREFVDKRGRPVKWQDDVPLFAMEPTTGLVATGAQQVITGPNHIELDAIDPRRPVLLANGYFQRYATIRRHRDAIRQQWLRIRKPFLDVPQGTVLIHCRRTDYVIRRTAHQQRYGSPAANTIEEYAACLRHFPEAERLIVTTDNPRDPFLEQFSRLGVPWTISPGPWDADFLLLASARWLIISQSTFSWWAGFLGRADHIACPLAPDSVWHFGRDADGPGPAVNLIVDDEPGRWIWVDPTRSAE